MIDLNNLIGPNSGWVLTTAYAINGGGEIAGSGLFDGVEHAFRLDPEMAAAPSAAANSRTPEPSTLSLAAIAGAIMFLWQLRLRRLRQDPRPAPQRSSAALR